MVDRLSTKAALGVLALASLAACTAQDRYDAVRRENLQECDRRLSEIDRQRCREQLAPATYEEYRRLRATVPRSSETGERRAEAPAR